MRRLLITITVLGVIHLALPSQGYTTSCGYDSVPTQADNISIQGGNPSQQEMLNSTLSQIVGLDPSLLPQITVKIGPYLTAATARAITINEQYTGIRLQFAFLHELGHVVDKNLLTPQARNAIVPGGWNPSSARDYEKQENWANGFAAYTTPCNFQPLIQSNLVAPIIIAAILNNTEI